LSALTALAGSSRSADCILQAPEVGLTRIGGSGPGVRAEHIALRVGGRVLGSRLPVTQDDSVAVGQGHSRVQRRGGAGSNRCDCAWLVCASVAKRACCCHSGCTTQRCASELRRKTPVSEKVWCTLHAQETLFGQRHCRAGRYNGASFKWYHYTGLDGPIVAEDSCSCISRWTCKRCSAKLHRRCQTHVQVLSVLGSLALGRITAGFQGAVVLIPVDVTAPGFFRRHLPSTPAIGALAARPTEGCAPKLHNTLCL